MSTNEMIKLPTPKADRPLSAMSNASSRGSERALSHEEAFDEIVPLVGAVPVAGPPVIPFVGAWALFVLMLTGPFLLLVTLVVAELVLVALVAAIIAPAYLLVRHLRRHLTRHSERSAPVGRFPAQRQVAVSLLPESPRRVALKRSATKRPTADIDSQDVVI